MAGWRDAIIAGQAAALVVVVGITASVLLRDRDSITALIKEGQAMDAKLAQKLEEVIDKQNTKIDQYSSVIGKVCTQVDNMHDTVAWIARTSYPERIRQLKEFPAILKKKEKEANVGG